MPIKVMLPLQGNATITIEGEVDYVKKTLGQIKELTDALGTEVAAIASQPITVTTPTTSMPGKAKAMPPTIPAEKKSVLTESLISLFNSDWGQVPRSFSDIKDALAANAIFRDKGTLAGTLFTLVQQNRLRRHKDTHKNQWLYTKY